MSSVICSINDEGKITEHTSYSCDPLHALVSYLEQTRNGNFKTWDYFAENFKDRAGKVHQTKSKYVDLVKELPSKLGYVFEVPGANTSIFARLV